MKILKILFASIFVASTINVNAQFTIDGQFRTRFITNHGYKVPVKTGVDPVFSFDQRSRLDFNYKSEKYSTRFTLQDARVFGSDDIYNPTGIAGNSNSLGVYEAWTELNISDNSSIRIGRQEWNYDDMRVLCWRNWRTSGLSYDGILYKMNDKDKGLFLDLGISYNNDGTRTGTVENSTWTGEKIKTMNFLNIKKQFNNKLTVSLMSSLSGKIDVNNNKLVQVGTQGLNANYNVGKQSTDGLFVHKKIMIYR